MQKMEGLNFEVSNGCNNILHFYTLIYCVPHLSLQKSYNAIIIMLNMQYSKLKV